MEQILNLLVDLPNWVDYIIIFAVLLACGLGLPLPEDIPLIASGYLIWQGSMDWVPVILVTMSAVLIGDSLLFYLGRKIGLNYLEKKKKSSWVTPARVLKVEKYFKRYGAGLVFFARFVMGLRSIVFLLAGAMKMRYRLFILLDGLAALLSVPLWVALGYWLSLHFWQDMAHLLKQVNKFKSVFLIVMILAVVVVALRFYIQFRQARAAAQKNSDARPRAGTVGKPRAKTRRIPKPKKS